MATARTRRMLRELILEGKVIDNDENPEETPKEPTKVKLHLNITSFKYIFNKLKNKLFPSKKGFRKNNKQSVEGGLSYFTSQIWGIIKLVIGYGVIGSFVLFLTIMLLPLQLPPLSDWIKGNGIIQIIISILGMGCLIYLFFDLVGFLGEVNKERKR